MTSTFPNVPLGPRTGRGGSRGAACRSSMTGTSGVSIATGSGASGPGSPSGSRRPNPSDPPLPTLVPYRLRRLPRLGVGHRAEALHPGEDPSLPIIEPFLDVHREDEPTAGRPDAIGDRHRVVRLMADREGDPGHAELLGSAGRPIVEADRRRARGQPLDLDLLPADPPDPEAEHLAHGLLGGPAPGKGLGPVPDVASLARGQDA